MKKASVQPGASAIRKVFSAGNTRYLLLLWLGFSAFRFILALLTRHSPNTNLDEFLYPGIASSLASGNGWSFRGQPADYAYPVYPLLLTPIYALFPIGTDYYRLIQLLSILLIDLSVFPLFALVSSLKPASSLRSRFGLTALLMLLPDFVTGEYLLSECVIYPLFFTAVWLCGRQLKKHEIKNLIGLAVTAVLLYETKPGQFVFPVLALLLSLLLGVKGKQKEQIVSSAIALGAVTATALISIAISSFSVYTVQMGATADGQLHLDKIPESILLYPYLLILSGGIVFFAVALLRVRQYPGADRRLFFALLVSLGVTVLGTAWLIDRYEFNSGTVHLRYIAMYLPVILCFALSDGQEQPFPVFGTGKPKKQSFPLPLLLFFAYIAVCTFVFGAGRGSGEGSTVSLLTFSLVNRQVLTAAQAYIWGIVLLAISAALTLLSLKKGERFAKKAVLGSVTVMLVLNGIAAYAVSSSALTAGREVLPVTGDSDYLYIFSDERRVDYCGLASNSKQNASYVELYDFFNFLAEAEDGVYHPFTPSGTLRGTAGGRQTPDTEYIVMDQTVYGMIGLSSSARALTTSDGRLRVAKLIPGERAIDSIIGNVNGNILKRDLRGLLLIFSPDLLQGPLTIRLQIEADSPGRLTLFCENAVQYPELSAGTQWVEATFDRPDNFFNFFCEEQDLRILNYELKN